MYFVFPSLGVYCKLQRGILILPLGVQLIEGRQISIHPICILLID